MTTTLVQPSSLSSWFLALRPKTLTAALIPVCVASALAYKKLGSDFKISLSLWALLVAFLIQSATNLINDALDFVKGTDTIERLGPRRVSASGWIAPQVVLGAGLFLLLAAFAAGIPLVQAAGIEILFLGLVSLLCAYLYTGGPAPLAYTGLGDPFVLIFFGWVATMGLFYIHTGFVSQESFIAGTQVGMLSTVLIAINNYRDIAEDSKNKKRTLAVRLGPQFVKAEVLVLIFGSFLLLFLWQFSLSPVAIGFWILLGFFGLSIVRKVFVTPPSKALNAVLGQSALLHLLFGLGLSFFIFNSKLS